MTTENRSGLQTPFFSICIPVYNVERYLSECLESVLSQSETDYEIILVDDGSQDNSGKICDEYAARYPNVVRVLHKENEGLLCARYDAVLRARGQYLMFLDSDDIYYPETLRKVRNVIESKRADMVLFDFMRFFPDGGVSRFTNVYEDGSIFEDDGKKRLYIDLTTSEEINSVWRKCIKRDLFDAETDYRKYKGLNQGEDKFLSVVFVDGAKRTAYLKEPLYGYRANLQSLTNNYALRSYQNMQAVNSRVDEFVARWGLSKDVVAKSKSWRLKESVRFITSAFAKSYEGKTARTEFEETVRYVAADEKFREAYAIGKRCVMLRERAICKLILRKNIKGLAVLLRVFACLRRVKQLARRR